jgi:hypothetical protein
MKLASLYILTINGERGLQPSGYKSLSGRFAYVENRYRKYCAKKENLRKSFFPIRILATMANLCCIRKVV